MNNLTKPVISVIIPSFKPGDYIYELIDSLSIQTYNNSLFEIIIILNGHKEHFYDSIMSYLKSNYSDINYKLLYSEWGNVSNARNIGLDNAQGEYFAFVDDDDILSPNYLEELSKSASNDCVAVSNTLSFNDSIKDSFKNYYSEKIDKVIITQETDIFKRRAFLSPVAFKLIHRDIIANKRYDTSFRNGQDTIFMFEISDKIKRIKICTKAYYYIRVRNNSASHTQTLLMRLGKCVNSIIKVSKIYFNNPLKYNFRLYISRVVGGLLSIYRR